MATVAEVGMMLLDQALLRPLPHVALGKWTMNIPVGSLEKTMTEAQRQLLELLDKGGIDVERDNDGQLVIYTGLWEDDEGNLFTENPNEEE